MGVTFIRNLISTIFVFALQPWTERVGLSWFYVTFGLIVTVILLGNVLVLVCGKRFRVRFAGRYLRLAGRGGVV